MGDVESSSRRRRRERIDTAIGFAIICATLTGVIAYRQLGYWLFTVIAVGLPSMLVIRSWLGTTARDRSVTISGLLRSSIIGFVIYTGAFAAGSLYYSIGRDPSWDRIWITLVLAIPAVIGGVARQLYWWRELQYVPDLLGETSPVTRLSGSAISMHLAGYAVGLAAALVAASLFEDWVQQTTAYFSAFIVGKLAVDLLTPLPAPLSNVAPSRDLAKMTVLSPLLWGLPWGLLIACHFFLSETSSHPEWALHVAVNQVWTVANITVAAIAVFALTTATAYVGELLTGDRSPAEPAAEDRLQPADWTRLFWGVVFLGFAGFAVIHEPFEPSDEEIFGVEKWTCGRQLEQDQVALIPRAGVRIAFHSHYIDLFNISCVPDKDGESCDYDKEGWREVTLIVERPGQASTRLEFARDHKDVRSDFRHHALIGGELAREVLAAFRLDTAAEMTIRGPNGRVLYVKRISLKGFSKAHNACQAKWG